VLQYACMCVCVCVVTHMHLFTSMDIQNTSVNLSVIKLTSLTRLKKKKVLAAYFPQQEWYTNAVFIVLQYITGYHGIIMCLRQIS